MNRAVLFAGLITLAAPLAGHAEGETLSIPIARSELARGWTRASEPAYAGGARLEVGASTWVPRDLQLPSFIATREAFKSSGFPQLSLGYLNHLRFLPESLAVRTGILYSRVERTGELPNQYISGSDQTLSLLSARAGLEWTPSFLKTRYASLLVGASALPTWGLAPSSIFDEGINSFGMAFEAAVGADFPLGGSGFSLNVMGTQTWGSVGTGSLAGKGLLSSLRFDI